MSTTFEVYPGSGYIPTFRELLDLSQRRLDKYLALRGLPTVRLGVRINSTDTSANKSSFLEVPKTLDDRCSWNDDYYAWFFIYGNRGGTDAYMDRFTNEPHISDLDDYELVEGLAEELSFSQEIRAAFRRCLNIGHYWRFRRSAGQTCLLSLAYGLIAASLAELTSGVIYSEDGAWSVCPLPAFPAQFVPAYFQSKSDEYDGYDDFYMSWYEAIPIEVEQVSATEVNDKKLEEQNGPVGPVLK